MSLNVWEKFDVLHPFVIKSLLKHNFIEPTEVQSHTLSDYKFFHNFIIASMTGSGKTLAFGLPILSELINQLENKEDQDKYIRVLILAPTRELALQIHKHLDVINENSRHLIRIVSLVGGMSKEKQERLMNKCPQIVIATPGRLWDLLDSGEIKYINTLNNIDYLVIDEADRMIELGHFNELNKILSYIYENREIIHDENQIKEFLNEKKPEMIIEDKNIELDEEFINNFSLNVPTALPNKFYYDEKTKTIKIRETSQIEDITNPKQKEKSKENFQIRTKKNNYKMKVFLVSATLTKFFKGSRVQLDQEKNKKQTKKGKRSKSTNPEENDTNPKLQSLIQKIKFTSKPKIIDLSQLNLMPAKLKEYKTICSEEEKPIYLYLYLKERENENFIIFNNSISYARKVTSLLTVLGFKCVSLHSQMQQKQRLSKFDKFINHEINIIICTDVAARGIDIPEVKNVIHYQTPKDIDTYVHRSGRTARIGKEGSVYSLIGPEDMRNYQRVLQELEKDKEIENIDRIIKKETQSLIENALKYEGLNHQINKKQRTKMWYEKNSKNADIELDDDIDKEIKKIEEQSTQKKVIVKERKIEMKKLKPELKQNNFRRNAIFLDPTTIHELSRKLESEKEMKKKK